MSRFLKKSVTLTSGLVALAAPALARENDDDGSWWSGSCHHTVRQSDAYGGTWSYWTNCGDGNTTYDTGHGYHRIAPNANCNWN